MRDIFQRVLGLRAKYGDGARILMEKMDVNNAFGQIPVDPDGAAAFGYVLGRYLIVDLRLQCRVERQSGVVGRDIGGDAACAA